MFQLSDPTILNYVAQMPTKSECRGNDGWFTSADSKRLRAFVLKVMADRISTFLQTTPVVVEKGMRVSNPVEQALLVDFDVEMVQQYLERSSDENESRMMLDGSEPNHLMVWINRYMSTVVANEHLFADVVLERVPEVQTVKVNKSRNSSSSSSSKAAAKETPVKSGSGAASSGSAVKKAAAPPMVYRSQPASTAGVPFTSSSSSSSSTHAAMQSLNTVEAFNIFGEEVEDDEDEDEDEMGSENDYNEEGQIVDEFDDDAFQAMEDALEYVKGNNKQKVSQVNEEEVNDFMNLVSKFRK